MISLSRMKSSEALNMHLSASINWQQCAECEFINVTLSIIVLGIDGTLETSDLQASGIEYRNVLALTSA